MIEIPISFLKPTSKNKSMTKAKSAQKNGGSKNNKKLKFIKEINQEVQMMMDAADENDMFTLPVSLQNTLKKKKGKKSQVQSTSKTFP